MNYGEDKSIFVTREPSSSVEERMSVIPIHCILAGVTSHSWTTSSVMLDLKCLFASTKVLNDNITGC